MVYVKCSHIYIFITVGMIQNALNYLYKYIYSDSNILNNI